jgi:predicted DNA-binding transcriptional regulator AlpA
MGRPPPRPQTTTGASHIVGADEFGSSTKRGAAELRQSGGGGDLPALDRNSVQCLPRFIDSVGLRKLFCVQRTKAAELAKQPGFPAAITLGGRHQLWDTTELLAWLACQPRTVRAMPPSLAVARRYRNGKLLRGSTDVEPSEVGFSHDQKRGQAGLA